jgi:ribosomal protein L11 methyltransferase
VKNPFAQPLMPLQLTMEAPAELLDILELLLEDVVLTITRPLDSVASQLIVIFEDAARDNVMALIANIAERQNAPMPLLHEVRLRDINWAEQVQKDFPAFTVARFYVHGSHVEGVRPMNRFPLLIDAAAAFGTGEHATTSGCLHALAAIKRQRPRVARILDMGCGTAILAIAAARLWKNATIEAYDNDPQAVKVAQHNIRANRTPKPIYAAVSDGYKSCDVKRAQPYDVIVANILARPLMKMARDAKRKLAPHGTLVLSGLLMTQIAMVASSYRMQGLYVTRVYPQGRWAVLELTRKGN